MNWLPDKRLSIAAVFNAVVIAAIFSSAVWGKPRIYSFDNGIEAEIYSSRTIIDEMTERDEDGDLILTVEEGWVYELIDDMSDPSIACKGDGIFYSHSEEDIAAALREVDLDGTMLDIKVEVYLLPFPRRGILRSTARGNKIFLTPGVYELQRQVSAFFVTHEFGHCFQNVYLPKSNKEKWRDYLSLRGIYGDTDYDDLSEHNHRPAEIFAEDFRYMFGGILSRYSGEIENPDLALPEDVDGLKEFFVSLVEGEGFDSRVAYSGGAVSISNYPNPFNPSTTINILFAEEVAANNSTVDVGIYSVDGALVKNLGQRRTDGTDLRIKWDGRTSNGAEAASGVYFCTIRAGEYVKSGKMLLIR
ncbi:MAG: T9SS type A sorting domain-containing protein [Candidatus Krumholzibacteriota bacterium]|nr:T9SS type A sorting domain-containing protein [Candidatus Krumholzibacteriota bacterium]